MKIALRMWTRGKHFPAPFVKTDFCQRQTGGFGIADGLVVDVGQVHDVPDAHPVELDHPAQNILERVRAEIPDVRKVVYRRPAGVETNGVVGDGFKFLHPPRKRVEYFHFLSSYAPKRQVLR